MGPAKGGPDGFADVSVFLTADEIQKRPLGLGSSCSLERRGTPELRILETPHDGRWTQLPGPSAGGH